MIETGSQQDASATQSLMWPPAEKKVAKHVPSVPRIEPQWRLIFSNPPPKGWLVGRPPHFPLPQESLTPLPF